MPQCDFNNCRVSRRGYVHAQPAAQPKMVVHGTIKDQVFAV
jgi:hypothetical protein